MKTEAESEGTMLSNEDYRNYFAKPSQSTDRLQMGVFSSFEGAQTKLNALREEFLEPMVVINDNKGEKVLFRVMMGQFQTMEEAESFRKILKNSFGLDAIIN